LLGEGRQGKLVREIDHRIVALARIGEEGELDLLESVLGLET